MFAHVPRYHELFVLMIWYLFVAFFVRFATICWLRVILSKSIFVACCFFLLAYGESDWVEVLVAFEIEENHIYKKFHDSNDCMILFNGLFWVI